MEFSQLKADIHVYVSCKFEMYIFDIAQVIGENVPIAFLYVLSICVQMFDVFQMHFLCWAGSITFIPISLD